MTPSTTTNTPARPKADEFQASVDERKANAQRFSGLKHDDECFLCGRGLTAKAIANGWMIHLGTDGTLLAGWDDPAAAADPTLSQGGFPMGSECAKRIPAPFKFRAVG